MITRRLLPFAIALLALTWALGSLYRSQPGGSLLINSYWILYALYALPLLGLGALVLLIVLIVLYLKGLSDSLGYGIARGLRKRKRKHWALRVLIVIYAWAFALVYIMIHCNGIICRASTNNGVAGVERLVSGGSSSSAVATLQGNFAGLPNPITWSWFIPAFLGLLVVSSVVMARSLVVAFRESRTLEADEIMFQREQVSEAVQDAIRIVVGPKSGDPRTRIINCYQRLILTGSRLGASLTPELTARELGQTMRRTFLLHGRAMDGLTLLFEEARYSLHSMSERDASTAHEYLVDISAEINPGQSRS